MGFHLFTLANIPVSVGPWYLLLLAYYTLSGDLKSGLLWCVIVTFSILVHEFGHALTAKHFKLAPRVMLHGLGGVTLHEQAERDRDDALIIAAGPLAGLTLGALTWAYAQSGIVLSSTPQGLWLEGSILRSLIFVNIYWSLLNLVPVYPLDGGQLFRLGLLRLLPAHKAERITFGVGMALSVVGIYLGNQVFESMLLTIIGLWTLIDNLRGWQGGVSAPVRSANHHAEEVHQRAIAAFDSGDYHEAVRLCHVIRAEQNVPSTLLKDVWRILGVASSHIGDFGPALKYLERAPASPTVTEAKIECLHQLDRTEDLQQLLASAEFQKLPAARRAQILEVLNGSE